MAGDETSGAANLDDQPPRSSHMDLESAADRRRGSQSGLSPRDHGGRGISAI